MGLFDSLGLSSLFGGSSPSPDGGWSSGTTINPSNSLTAQNLQGGFAGLTPAGKGLMQGIGKGMMGAANQMPGSQGAFKAPGDLSQNDPNQQALQQFLAQWKQKHFGGTPPGGNMGGSY